MSELHAALSFFIDSQPTRLVRMRLEFLRPFKATNLAKFTLAPNSDQTQVRWAMSGRKNFVMKTFHAFCYVDKMVGKDFEKGLAAMKAIAERRN